MRLPLLISVPHGGLEVPGEVEGHCILTGEQVRQDGDEGAAEIYAIGDRVQAFLTTRVARAIVDLNRPAGDRGADGVVKTHTCLDVPVYEPPPPPELLEALLERHYHPWHRRLEELARSGVRMGIDCHTMLAVGPPMGPMAGRERPRICLGDADGASCPPRLADALASALQEAFQAEVARNDPFRGGFITRSRPGGIPWVQIELSRAPFLDNRRKRAAILRALEIFCRSAGWSPAGG